MKKYDNVEEIIRSIKQSTGPYKNRAGSIYPIQLRMWKIVVY